MNRRLVAVWALYDFANSVYPAVITATVFGVYYATGIVGNETGLGDLWWGRVLSVSMLFVALSSPVLGSIADLAGCPNGLRESSQPSDAAAEESWSWSSG